MRVCVRERKRKNACKEDGKEWKEVRGGEVGSDARIIALYL